MSPHAAETQPNWLYDVFVSYSELDKSWVRDVLQPRLAAAGLTVADFRSFRAGIAKTEEIAHLIQHSRKTLLVLSPHYFADDRASLEQHILQSLDLVNKSLRLIPLRKALCALPLEIGYMTYVDFAETDDPDFEWQRLLQALEPASAQTATKLAPTPSWSLVHPYAMQPNFTGRQAEQARLSQWLGFEPNHPLLMVRALGGFGKSALVWHWLVQTQQVDKQRWSRVMWWSFYERDANWDNFAAAALQYLAPELEISGPRLQSDGVLDQLRQPNTLLILDGCERLLRAYSSMTAAYQADQEHDQASQHHQRDCTSPIAEDFLRKVATLPNLQGKVLLTTRIRPRILEPHDELLIGCAELELKHLAPEDAVSFLQAQGIQGSSGELEATSQTYGYHPLSLRLLAGRILKDFEQPGDIAAARHIDVNGDLRQRQHHVLAQAYNHLDPASQRLLSRIACFRNPVAYNVLRTLDPQSTTLNDELHDLIGRGFVQRDAERASFDLHPIVRRYAYSQLALADRRQEHTRISAYFAALPQPSKPQRLEDIMSLIELYHHMVQAGHTAEAFALFKNQLYVHIYHNFSDSQITIELLHLLLAADQTSQATGRSSTDQGWLLFSLGKSYARNGQVRQACTVLEQSIAYYKINEDPRQVRPMSALASVSLLPLGKFKEAELVLHQVIALIEQANPHLAGRQIPAHQHPNPDAQHIVERQMDTLALQYRELGRSLSYRGQWQEAATALKHALLLFQELASNRLQSSVWFYLGLRAVLMDRSEPAAIHQQTAMQAAQQALGLLSQTAYTSYDTARDNIQALWLLGAAHRISGNLAQAQLQLDDALNRCRRGNLVEAEANIVLELARVHLAQAQVDVAKTLAEEALLLAERCEYVLQAADAYLLLAEIALAVNQPNTARTHAEHAHTLATCDGSPAHTYHVAHTEASALLTHLTAKNG